MPQVQLTPCIIARLQLQAYALLNFPCAKVHLLLHTFLLYKLYPCPSILLFQSCSSFRFHIQGFNLHILSTSQAILSL